MAGAIAMLAVFVVVTIEMFFATRGAGHSHESEWTRVPADTPSMGLRGGEFQDNPSNSSSHQLPLHNLSPSSPNTNGHVVSPKTRSNNPEEDSDDDLDDLDPLTSNSTSHHHHRQPSIRNPHSPASPDNPQKLLLQCLLLEAGILFHSIFIGMAVSVATGTAFLVLLVAICFHQTFEGFALGSRIAALIPDLFEPSSPKPWLMALAYGTTTPIGQAIGIWMHGLYDPQSELGLLMVGVTNAISSGLLLFAGLVQLIAEDFLSESSYETLTGWRRVEACAAVGLGGLLMAVVGAFA